MIENKNIEAFNAELRNLINKHSLEGMVDMPDAMLADYLCSQIRTLSNTLNKRDKWFSVDMCSEDKKLVKKQLGLFAETDLYSGC